MNFLYSFIISFILFGCKNAKNIKLDIKPEAVYFLEENDSILTYQTSNKSINGNYSRTHYIHPLYTLDGEHFTEDFPKDHPHHRGIFWAWHQLYVNNNRVGDGWELTHFNQEILKTQEIHTSNKSKAIISEVLWKSDKYTDSFGIQIPFIKENTQITVFPKQNNHRNIDIEISLLALKNEVRIGGSEDPKGYGGFSTRIKLPNDVIFTSNSKNIIPDNLPVNAGSWMDISGTLSKISGLTILCHPKNPEPINKWILRSKRSMQNAVYPYPGSKTVAVSTTNPTILRYRLVVHNGAAQTINIPKIYENYIQQ